MHEPLRLHLHTELSETPVRALVSGLVEGGVCLSHLGKSDPPKRWTGDEDAAVRMIMSGTDLTNWTFLRDANSRVDLSVELHRDPRWEHDTVSLSGPETKVRDITQCLVRKLDHYVAILGVVGGGKTQAWQVVSVSADCPQGLKRQFTNAEPGGPANGSQPIRAETNRTSGAAGSRR